VGADDKIDSAVLAEGHVGLSFRAGGTARYSVLLPPFERAGSPGMLPSQLGPCECALSGLLCVGLVAPHF